MRIIESTRPSIDARGQSIDLQLASGSVLVHADSTRLSQVIFNLVGNAIKYTPDGGRIDISTEFETYEAVLRVRDNGIGISPDLLPRIFDLFVQGETSLARTESGLGIGLTLVKRLTELQGGTVEASSGRTGPGSEFTVRLPRALHRDAARAPVELVAENAGQGHRLLVVDDNRDAADTLAVLLAVMGHEVRMANDGATALSVAADFRPDAIFLDIGLPGMNGYEVARRLRELPDFATVSLIAFTGYGQDEDYRRVREAGFDHHMVKPVRAADLVRIIEGLNR